MLRIHHLLAGCALMGTAAAAAAQYPVASYPQPYPQPGYVNPFAPLGDADQLAQQLRQLAADPSNIYALINAARLSLKLGDTDAAAALYTRADKAAPGNPQVKAGMARLLVNAQRPGEALRLFQEAAQAGASDVDFGPDRALAYDLIGEQPRAQREYRALLRRGPDDEATRRYALSLAISGLQEPALALLEPLNRRSDRGAWRARAFVLAMTGDRAGAERIATTMMPVGMADGLRPFFDRLPRLAATDRAFAVHFGEVRGSAARYADARRTPALPALAPEPNPFAPVVRPVQVAVVQPGSKKRRRDQPAAVVAARLPVQQPYVAPLPSPPAPTAVQLAALGANRLPPPPEAYGAAPFAPAASRGVTVLPPPADAYRPRTPQLAQNVPVQRRIAMAEPVARDTADDGGDDDAPTASPGTTRVATVAGPVLPPPTGPVAASLPSTAPPQLGLGTPLSSPTLPPPTQPAAVLADPPVGFALASPAPAPVATIGVPPPPRGETGDAVLAAIVANIQIPPSELADPTPAPLGETKLLSTVEKKAETRAAVAAATRAAEDDAALPRKDARGRFVDARGRPLLDARRRPLTARAAAVWQSAQADDAADPKDPLPRRDARGRFVDARGKPLLDTRGRPLTVRAAAAWQSAQADDVAGAKDPLPRKDARGRFVDARGRPLNARAVAALQAAGPAGAADVTVKLPRQDARGRFVDAKGKPLRDARGRLLDAKAATLALAAADDSVEPKDKLPRQDARGRFVDARGKPLLDTRGRPLTERAAAAWQVAAGKPTADAKERPASSKAEPARIWVQVAGGANEATLDKAWARVADQAPALKGKPGWTTPLRATNRVLTGPFKTNAEAMALVGQLKQQGVAAFMFTSNAGQKVARLGSR